jgi:hypothetical protein
MASKTQILHFPFSSMWFNYHTVNQQMHTIQQNHRPKTSKNWHNIFVILTNCVHLFVYTVIIKPLIWLEIQWTKILKHLVLSIVHKSPILTATGWNKMHEHWLMGNWNTGNQCTAYQHAQLSAKCQQYGPDNWRQWNWKVYPKVIESQKIHSQRQMQPFPQWWCLFKNVNNNKDKINIEQYGRQTS